MLKTRRSASQSESATPSPRAASEARAAPARRPRPSSLPIQLTSGLGPGPTRPASEHRLVKSGNLKLDSTPRAPSAASTRSPRPVTPTGARPAGRRPPPPRRGRSSLIWSSAHPSRPHRRSVVLRPRWGRRPCAAIEPTVREVALLCNGKRQTMPWASSIRPSLQERP
jgi:hypothetical protein